MLRYCVIWSELEITHPALLQGPSIVLSLAQPSLSLSERVIDSSPIERTTPTFKESPFKKSHLYNQMLLQIYTSNRTQAKPFVTNTIQWFHDLSILNKTNDNKKYDNNNVILVGYHFTSVSFYNILFFKLKSECHENAPLKDILGKALFELTL